MIYNVTSTAVAAGTANTAAVSAAANMRLMGLTVRENAAAAAVLNVCNGTASSDPIVCPISLVASDSKIAWFGPQGIPCAGGVYINRVSGNSTLTVYTAIDN